MTEIQDVRGTAFIVAEFRAWENAAPHPLFVDPVVPIFLDARTRAAAERMVAGFPPGEWAVHLRTRYLDDHLDLQLTKGCRQVVILGSGLDTRGVRKAAPGVVYFEIDDKDIIDFKKARLKRAGFEAPIVFIAGNYVTDGLMGMLEANGFDRDAPSYVIWEGNTMYLTKPAVLGVLQALRRHVGRCAISMDYMSEEIIAGRTGDPRTSRFVEHFAEMGAPWRFGVDDLGALAGEAGMAVVDNAKLADLHHAYRPGRPLEGAFLDNYSICTLEPA
ncbi:MAG: class I SAM-dependent methyltransferase [Alphaproteobacteria bacterium]|nr:class I SAM-dependent methyltransferase [Alphaproteobacteria bacterium]